MAAKKPPIKSPVPAVRKMPEVAKSVSTPVRNTAVPKTIKPMPAGAKEITSEMISKRAYEIWQSGKGGSEHDNWTSAETELRSKR